MTVCDDYVMTVCDDYVMTVCDDYVMTVCDDYVMTVCDDYVMTAVRRKVQVTGKFVTCTNVADKFQPTNPHNCHLIHSNIVTNITLLHVWDPTGPSSWSTYVSDGPVGSEICRSLIFLGNIIAN